MGNIDKGVNYTGNSAAPLGAKIRSHGKRIKCPYLNLPHPDLSGGGCPVQPRIRRGGPRRRLSQRGQSRRAFDRPARMDADELKKRLGLSAEEIPVVQDEADLAVGCSWRWVVGKCADVYPRISCIPHASKRGMDAGGIYCLPMIDSDGRGGVLDWL